MAGTEEPIETSVQSSDGTEIAYWTTGVGPPLVLVHGALGDHTRWRPLLLYLDAHATVHAMDRRGRGASGDAPGYRVEREFEDIAAVVDAVANASGSVLAGQQHLADVIAPAVIAGHLIAFLRDGEQ